MRIMRLRLGFLKDLVERRKISFLKDLESQATTWSDCKSHNTITFLIYISSTGFIAFLSSDSICMAKQVTNSFAVGFLTAWVVAMMKLWQIEDSR